MKSLLALTGFSVFAFLSLLVFTTFQPDAPTAFEEVETPGESDALKAFDWWYDQRALPNELIPNGAYQRAAYALKSGKLKIGKDRAADAVGADVWTSLGPTNVGGRTLAIAVNPSNSNIVWAGSASGGLWKSTTAGEGNPGWTFVNTGFPLISVSAIAIDSINPNLMYIGTGEISRYKRPLVGTSGARASYGMGILKSTNGGATWDTTGLTFTFPEITAIERIVINPQNSNTVFAATSEGTFKTVDGGKNWGLSCGVLMAMDLVINPVDTTILYVSCGNLNSTVNPGIYVTFDAGDNWLQIQNGLPATNFGRTPLAISRTNPAILYAAVSDGSSGSGTGLFKTSNAGTTWSLVYDTNWCAAQGWYDNVVAVDPTDDDHVYLSGFDFYESVDGGHSFTGGVGGQVHVDHHAITFDPNDPLTMYVGCDGGIFKSIDGGNQFSNLNQGYVTTQFYPGLSMSPLDSNVAMGGLQDNSTVHYFGQPYWQTVIGGDGGWTAVNSQNKNILYGESQYLAIARSTDGGGLFTNINSGLPSGSGNANFIPPFTISYSSPNVLYAGGRNVFKSTNGGTSWFRANGNPNDLNGTFISAVAASWTSPDTVMTATGSGATPSPLFKVYSSTNGGAVWNDVTVSLPFRYPTDIEFDPVDSRVAYVTFGGYGSGHLYKTTNLGFTWTDLSANLPDIPHQAITADPAYPSHLYVGNDIGVFYSSDGGGSWNEYSTGMPPAMVLDLVVSRSNNALRAATFGNGVYERKLPRLPEIAVTRPIGGEVWVGGAMENITWTKKFVNAVKIQYSLDGGSSWSTVVDSVPATPGSYAWQVPSIETSQGLIRMTEAGNTSYRDTSGATFSILVNPEVLSGWNMISLDRNVADGRKNLLFPSATTGAFAYAGSYQVKDTLVPGPGYWLKYGVPEHVTYAGDSVTTDSVTLRAGWNMIGSLTLPVATSTIVQSPPGIVISSYFGYSGGYQVATTLQPKKGYWVKTNAVGKIFLASSAQVPSSAGFSSFPAGSANELSIQDAAGNSQTLYFGGRLDGIDAEMPPTPPAPAFDARFTSGKIFEPRANEDRTLSIAVRGAVSPVRLRWTVRTDGNFSIVAGASGEISMRGQGEYSYSSAGEDLIGLRMSAAASAALPENFELLQNFPNPFNPSTEIRYNLASSGGISEMRRVTLTVYDLTGRKVATLVDALQASGNYVASWDARDVASGIYFSVLSVAPAQGETAGSSRYSATRKMLLVR